MARVLISKASLADFGVPRQEVAVRQPTPTAEQIEQAVRQSDIALTPMQYATKVPLFERKHAGRREKFAQEGEIPREFKGRMGTEGALAHGVAARDYPQLLESEPRNIPFLRDYYGRQTTLPEFDWSYKTEGPYYDEQGNILPGQVPPVDAVKVMGADDIAQIGDVTGFGLKPTPFGSENINWEESTRAEQRFPVNRAGFVGGFTPTDMLQNVAGNVGSGRRKGVVGIRGFGRPQDKAFARGSFREGREGIYTEPIPPERLVGVMGDTPISEDEAMSKQGRLRDVHSPEKSFEQKLYELVDEGQIAPMDAMYALIRDRVHTKNYKKPFEGVEFYPSDVRGTDAADRNLFLRPKKGDTSDFYRENRLTPAYMAYHDTRRAFDTALPQSWEQGVFGFENPLLTEEEKEEYMRDIESRDNPMRDDVTPKDLPSLFPKQAGVRYA